MRLKNNRKVRLKFVNAVKSFKPDLLYLQIQHTKVIDASSIKIVKDLFPKMKVVNWTGDVREGVPGTLLKVGKVSDYNMISSTGQIPMFEKVLHNVSYLQIGYNPKLYYPPAENKTTFKYDVSFIGHYNAKERYPGANERKEACSILRSTFGNRFALYGGYWAKEYGSKGSINQRHLLDVYHNSICNLSISHFNDIAHYFSDRLLMCMAAGRPVISLKFPKWESYFTDNCDLVMVDSVSQIPEKVQMLKDNPELANFIGQQGAAKVLAEHTYYSRIKELLEKVKL